MQVRHLPILILLGMSACVYEPAYASGRARQPEPIVSETPLPPPSPLPTSLPPRQGVYFEPDPYYSTLRQRENVAKAAAILMGAVKSDCFTQFMSKRALIDTTTADHPTPRTPAEVAAHIQGLSGTVSVQFYYRCIRSWKCPLGTIAEAYRNPGEATIHLNTAYFPDGVDLVDLAATLGHEDLGHALGGYDHSYNWTPTRDFSVPYSIGGSTAAHGGDAVHACQPHG